jgi:hypothetical protein
MVIFTSRNSVARCVCFLRKIAASNVRDQRKNNTTGRICHSVWNESDGAESESPRITHHASRGTIVMTRVKDAGNVPAAVAVPSRSRRALSGPAPREPAAARDVMIRGAIRVC